MLVEKIIEDINIIIHNTNIEIKILNESIKDIKKTLISLNEIKEKLLKLTNESPNL